MTAHSVRAAHSYVRPLPKAVNKALEGEAKWKYFQHSGALLTADGSDDDLIKFEGAPEGYKVNVPCV